MEDNVASLPSEFKNSDLHEVIEDTDESEGPFSHWNLFFFGVEENVFDVNATWIVLEETNQKETLMLTALSAANEKKGRKNSKYQRVRIDDSDDSNECEGSEF